MAITVKYLTELGIEKEIADKIFAERGKEIENENAKLSAVKAELDESKNAFQKLESEFNQLKAANATADDYKAKYEAIIAENQARQKQEEADKIARERQENISRRFEAVVGEKNWRHEAIKADYLKKFGEALEDKKNEGMSDGDIFHNLVKDDKDAFVGVEVVQLPGGAKKSIDDLKVTKDDFKKMSYKQRLDIYNNNQDLYNQLNQ